MLWGGLSVTLAALVFCHPSAANPWQEGLAIDAPRDNVYELPTKSFERAKQQGLQHALVYPVESTGIVVPNNALRKFLSSDLAKTLPLPFNSLEGFWAWLGLVPFPENRTPLDFEARRPKGQPEDLPIGASVIRAHMGQGLTIGCTSCHASSLFGKSVIGMPNKAIRANKLFVLAKLGLQGITPMSFQLATGASPQEVELFRLGKENLEAVGAHTPLALGLDTSLSHVGRSLAKRRPDSWATRSSFWERFPRPHQLDFARADSKPGTWWLLKYKNRWLSDGSVVSGNPVITNILWNEIGRGSDLRELDSWVDQNTEKIKELSTFVFSSRAPKWNEIFPQKELKLERVKRGSRLFHANCYRCHGSYKKGFDLDQETSREQALETIEVDYHEQTPVIDVGTDPLRWQGIKELSSQLNNLAISAKHDIVVKMQKGYVPPPLVGIFARYPYFHNNSAPSLCAVLSLPEQRPSIYYQGPSNNPATDYDFECAGYPTAEGVPPSWKEISDARFDTSTAGMGNGGHWKMLVDEQGQQRYNRQQKLDLIEFLKSL